MQSMIDSRWRGNRNARESGKKRWNERDEKSKSNKNTYRITWIHLARQLIENACVISCQLLFVFLSLSLFLSRKTAIFANEFNKCRI